MTTSVLKDGSKEAVSQMSRFWMKKCTAIMNNVTKIIWAGQALGALRLNTFVRSSLCIICLQLAKQRNCYPALKQYIHLVTNMG